MLVRKRVFTIVGEDVVASEHVHLQTVQHRVSLLADVTLKVTFACLDLRLTHRMKLPSFRQKRVNQHIMPVQPPFVGKSDGTQVALSCTDTVLFPLPLLHVVSPLHVIAHAFSRFVRLVAEKAFVRALRLLVHRVFDIVNAHHVSIKRLFCGVPKRAYVAHEATLAPQRFLFRCSHTMNV